MMKIFIKCCCSNATYSGFKYERTSPDFISDLAKIAPLTTDNLLKHYSTKIDWILEKFTPLSSISKASRNDTIDYGDDKFTILKFDLIFIQIFYLAKKAIQIASIHY